MAGPRLRTTEKSDDHQRQRFDLGKSVELAGIRRSDLGEAVRQTIEHRSQGEDLARSVGQDQDHSAILLREAGSE